MSIQPDKAHDLTCTVCHGGVEGAAERDQAHSGLIAQPAHPTFMAAACGPCHQAQVKEALPSPHFTLHNKINRIRRHFGVTQPLATALEIPLHEQLNTPVALADDLLRRRCLRCHVYSRGDKYPAVTHGTGCAACHLPFDNGKLRSHTFVAPTELQCLSCHYSNHVGSDYLGQYEHDYNWEYRTPYTTRPVAMRPYGVETHELSPDLHQQRGLTCLDCHHKSGHGTSVTLSCEGCHGWKPGKAKPTQPQLRIQDNTLRLTSRQDGKEHVVPALRHPAHQQYGKKVACQVCHAQWSFNDAPTHLLLAKNQAYEPWERLTVQGSSEVENWLNRMLSGSEDQEPPVMRDGLTGKALPGIWYQGFGQRRWEQMVIRKDTDGIIKVFRPILDLHLSLVEADETVPFDSISGQTSGLRPYTPHTTGPAGMFYRDRFHHLLSP